MSREKLSWFCANIAWLPMIMAWPASALRLLPAAIIPRIRPAIISGICRPCRVMIREMWRCVTCESSCPSTVASSSRLPTTATSPRLSPR